MTNIAAILTCFNRKEKTLSSLTHLYSALQYYNHNADDILNITVYLTDDACTDGTADTIRSSFPDKEIHISRSEGNLFWARGMNHSWKEAASSETEWDYFLLLNDDTDMTEDCLDKLFKTQQYSMECNSKEAIVSGITAAKENHNEITYGGSVFLNRFKATLQQLQPSDYPQRCDLMNANIVLVPMYAFQKLGFFYPYQHGCADSDYAVMANRADIPVYVSAEICGYCDHDHWSRETARDEILKMSLKQRKTYFSHPLHSNRDYLTMVRRIMPWRFPLVCIFRFMSLYFPRLYYRLTFNRARQ